MAGVSPPSGNVRATCFFSRVHLRARWREFNEGKHEVAKHE